MRRTYEYLLSVNQTELLDALLNAAVTRPVFIWGAPQTIDGKSVFCPPCIIARDEPYCLFLDELNGCSQEVQKSFYSLIHDRRIGEYLRQKVLSSLVRVTVKTYVKYHFIVRTSMNIIHTPRIY